MEIAFWQVAGEELGKNERDWVEKVRKVNGGCFSCSYDRVGGPGGLLVFFQGIWLIIKGSPSGSPWGSPRSSP